MKFVLYDSDRKKVVATYHAAYMAVDETGLVLLKSANGFIVAAIHLHPGQSVSTVNNE